MQSAKFILVSTWHSFLSDFNNLTKRQLELVCQYKCIHFREFCSVLTATGSTAAISDANVNACIAFKSIPIFADAPSRDNPVKEHIT